MRPCCHAWIASGNWVKEKDDVSILGKRMNELGENVIQPRPYFHASSLEAVTAYIGQALCSPFWIETKLKEDEPKTYKYPFLRVKLEG